MQSIAANTGSGLNGSAPSPVPRSSMVRLTSFALATLLAVSLAVPSRSAAQDASVRQAALILRILSYDRNLTQRATDEVVILVAFRAGDSSSEAEHERIVTALNTIGRRTTVARMHARAVAVAFTNRTALEATARREHASAIYVCGGLSASISAISGVARSAHMLSLTGVRANLGRGLAVGFIASGSEVQLVVALRAVEAEGARLDATVLRLAEVIR